MTPRLFSGIEVLYRFEEETLLQVTVMDAVQKAEDLISASSVAAFASFACSSILIERDKLIKRY